MEKRVLVWMAERAPVWVTSDGLTILGLSAQIAAGICYGLARYDRRLLLLVIVFIALNWVGDSLDGTLARVRQQQRPRYGFYVDHVVDMFGSMALMCDPGCSGFAHWPVAIAMLLGFMLLASESFLASHTLGCFQMSQGIFGPTEIRILLIIGKPGAAQSVLNAVWPQDVAVRSGWNDWRGRDVCHGDRCHAPTYGGTLPPGAAAMNQAHIKGSFAIVAIVLQILCAVIARAQETIIVKEQDRYSQGLGTDCAYENVFVGPSFATGGAPGPTFTGGATIGQYFARTLGKGITASHG